MDKQYFFTAMEKICPGELAEEWDNCGIQVNTQGNEVKKILTALEITDAVIDEAISESVDMIITHHPMTRQGLKSIDSREFTGRYITRCIEHGISVYACHTSFDKMDGGNNDYLGKLLKLQNVGFFENCNPFCRRGFLKEEMSIEALVRYAAEVFGVDSKYFKYVGEPNIKVKKLGWCTGGGAGFIDDAAKEGCDLYITGDVKYHDAQAARAINIPVLDAGHYGTEKIFAPNMCRILKDYFEKENFGSDSIGEYDIVASSIDINPYLW